MIEMTKINAILLFIFLSYTKPILAVSCYKDLSQPFDVLAQYFSDLTKKDITILPKYFGGDYFKKVELRWEGNKTEENFSHMQFLLLFGVSDLDRQFLKVECRSPDEAWVSYVGRKAGTPLDTVSRIQMIRKEEKWYIGDKKEYLSE